MKNTYPIFLKNIEEPAHLIDLIKAINRAFNKFDLQFIIIGAFVRDFWLKHIHQFPESKRRTRDIDMAVFAKKAIQIEELIDYLVNEEGFKLRGNKFHLVSKEGIEIDLSPFGDIEAEEGYSNWVTKGEGKIPSTLGLQEAFHLCSEIVDSESDTSFRIITLEGLAMLKIISWNDRPEIRPKDAIDLAFILDHYYAIQMENIYDNHWDLLNEYKESDIPWKVGSRVLGRNMQMITNQNQNLKTEVIRIIQNQLSSSPSKLANTMVDSKCDYQKREEMLRLLLEGLNDPL